ncbi:MAG TPA: hypothetical protein VM100_08215 [Longimicrobiales bacterium]|nr:hypothetical protein [Longimicrobiales bacterium]
MNDERFDFSTLDLDKDPATFERMVGNIMWRAKSELKRRRGLTPVEAVAAWFRPAMVAAAAIATVSLTMLATERPAAEEVATGAYMSSAEVPIALTSWYEEGSSPTVDELLVANEGDK